MKSGLDHKIIGIVIFGPLLALVIYTTISSKYRKAVADNRHRLILLMGADLSEADLQQFITKKIDLNIEDEDGVSFLEAAVGGKKLKNVKWLIEHKAEMNHQDRSGKTALHISAAEGDYEITEALLSAGGNPSVRDRQDELPVDLAQDEKIKRLLSVPEKNRAIKNAN
jgi:ankyrin repeat protein